VTLFDNAEHNITATATDSDGKSASDSASLTIGTSPPSPFDRTAKHRLIPIGISTGHPDITAGTIGARVTDGAGNVYALSNNHVYADVNAASIGVEVLQPGSSDGGSAPGDVIGTLAAYKPIVTNGTTPNAMDAAIALISGVTLEAVTPPDGYGTPSSATVPAEIGMGVQKYGRTTGQTFGVIELINVNVQVCYGTIRGRNCFGPLGLFTDQISISDGSFSAGGDSGSLIVTNDPSANPVGLLFAGSSSRTLANPIAPILAEFGVTITGTP